MGFLAFQGRDSLLKAEKKSTDNLDEKMVFPHKKIV